MRVSIDSFGQTDSLLDKNLCFGKLPLDHTGLAGLPQHINRQLGGERGGELSDGVHGPAVGVVVVALHEEVAAQPRVDVGQVGVLSGGDIVVPQVAGQLREDISRLTAKYFV